MKLALTSQVDWVGKIDWELKSFHGDEYSTHRGSSYNAFIVKGSEKTVLIDTVWSPYAKEFVDNLEAEGLLDKIDAIITNHAEPDHSGAMPELLRRRPGLPIYCTSNATKSLQGHYHQAWDFHIVKTGDRLDLGDSELIFIEAPMLHWPDTMFCYLTSDNILFSSDAFGQHLASADLYNDTVDQAVLQQEAIKYYANILTPFSGFVLKKIAEFVSLNLPLSMIAPAHGVIWRDNPLQIVTQYQEWANDYQENFIAIIYDTMWDGTRRLAEAIAEGLHEVCPNTNYVLHNAAKTDKNDIVSDVFRAKAIIMGSPTINRGILHSIAGLLEQVRGLGFHKKKAAAFGSYGWSGESPVMIREALSKAGFEIIGDGLKQLWHADTDGLEAAKKFGREIGKLLD